MPKKLSCFAVQRIHYQVSTVNMMPLTYEVLKFQELCMTVINYVKFCNRNTLVEHRQLNIRIL